jgi:hypothetical protein
MSADSTFITGPFPNPVSLVVPEKPYSCLSIAERWDVDSVEVAQDTLWQPSFLVGDRPAPLPVTLPVAYSFPMQTVVMGFGLLFIGTLVVQKFYKSAAMNLFFNSLFSPMAFRRFMEDEEPGWPPSPFWVYFGAIFFWSANLLWGYHQIRPMTSGMEWWWIGGGALAGLLLPVARILGLGVLGRIYRIELWSVAHMQLSYQFHILWSLHLLAGWIVYAYLPAFHGYMLDWIWLSGALSMGWHVLRMVSLAWSERGIPLFYFLLYLCTLELLPLGWCYLHFGK